MFVTNWISTIKIQKISEITNFFRHYFLSRTEVMTLIVTAGDYLGTIMLLACLFPILLLPCILLILVVNYLMLRKQHSS